MLNLYANPYDTSATGFYFDDLESWEKQYSAAEEAGVEEFEIDFIDGSDNEQALFEALDICQPTIGEFFDAVNQYGDDDDFCAKMACLADNGGYMINDLAELEDAAESVDYYAMPAYSTYSDFATEIADERMDIPDHIAPYFDYNAYGMELEINYNHVDYNGERLFYTIG